MTLEEFDRDINTAVDVLIDSMRTEMELYAKRVMELADAADKAALPTHLMIASVTNAQKRLATAGERFAQGDFS